MLLQLVGRDRISQSPERKRQPEKISQRFAPATETEKLIAQLRYRRGDCVKPREINFHRMNQIAWKWQRKWVAPRVNRRPDQPSRRFTLDVENTSALNPVFLEEPDDFEDFRQSKFVVFAIVPVLELPNSSRPGKPVGAPLQPLFGKTLGSVIFELKSQAVGIDAFGR